MTVQLVHGSQSSYLRGLVDDYLAHCRARGLAPRTLDGSYGYSLHDVFLPWCAEQGIDDLGILDSRALDRFTSSLLQRQRRNGQPISRYTVAAYVRPVRLFLGWASREGETVKAKPQLPRCSKPLRDVLSREEIEALEQAMPAERDKIIIRIFSDCGLRLEELTRLTAECVVRSGHHAYLRVLGKRSRVRDVPIPPQLLRRLLRHIAGRPNSRTSEQVFLSLRRGPAGDYDAMTPHGVGQVVTEAGARAKLGKRVHAHLLRHSWMTEMLRNGMNAIQLSVIAGASPQVIAEHYTHLNKDDAYEAMMLALAVQTRERRQRR